MPITNSTAHSSANTSDAAFFTDIPEVTFSRVLTDLLDPPENLCGHRAVSGAPDPALLLSPIIVSPTSNGRFGIIDGCKRLSLYQSQDAIQCPCLVTVRSLDEKKRGLLRLAMNKNRPQTLSEKIMFLSWITAHFSGNTFEETATACGFSKNVRSELEPLLKAPEIVIDAVQSGKLHLRCVPDFLRLSTEDQSAFLATFDGLFPSLQTQREFLEWLPEIAWAEKTTPAAILSSTGVTALLADAARNAPQKIDALHALLHARKFPRYSAALTLWKKETVAAANAATAGEAGIRVQFIPSPAFEHNTLECRITVSQAPAARETFRRLAELPATVWSKLIYPLWE